MVFGIDFNIFNPLYAEFERGNIKTRYNPGLSQTHLSTVGNCHVFTTCHFIILTSETVPLIKVRGRLDWNVLFNLQPGISEYVRVEFNYAYRAVLVLRMNVEYL